MLGYPAAVNFLTTLIRPSLPNINEKYVIEAYAMKVGTDKIIVVYVMYTLHHAEEICPDLASPRVFP